MKHGSMIKMFRGNMSGKSPMVFSVILSKNKDAEDFVEMKSMINDGQQIKLDKISI